MRLLEGNQRGLLRRQRGRLAGAISTQGFRQRLQLFGVRREAARVSLGFEQMGILANHGKERTGQGFAQGGTAHIMGRQRRDRTGRDISARNGRKDLFTSLIERLGMSVSSIVIESLHDGVFTASVRLASPGSEEMRLEVHVSEAMLLSLKYRLPVMVESEIMSHVATLDMNEEGFAKENNARRFVDFLDHLDPSTMGKYPM